MAPDNGSRISGGGSSRSSTRSRSRSRSRSSNSGSGRNLGREGGSSSISRGNPHGVHSAGKVSGTGEVRCNSSNVVGSSLGDSAQEAASRGPGGGVSASKGLSNQRKGTVTGPLETGAVAESRSTAITAHCSKSWLV